MNDIFQDESAAPSTATETDDLSDLFEDTVEGSSSSSDDTLEAAAATNDEPKADVQEAPKETPNFQRRIDKLVAKARAAEAKAMEQEHQVLAFQEAFNVLKQQYEAAQNKLSEYDAVTPAERELAELKLKQVVAAKASEMKQIFEQKVALAKEQAEIELRTEQMLEDIDSAVEQFPGLTAKELALAILDDPSKDIKDTARALHESKVKAYEAYIKGKQPIKPVAPKPFAKSATVVNNSTVKKSSKFADVISELDEALGPDWAR